MKSKPEKETFAIHTHHPMSQEDNQSMKFGQLIEYMRNIFAEKLYTKCGGETSQTLFQKINIENISGSPE